MTQQQAAYLATALALDAEGEIADATITGATGIFTDAPPITRVVPGSPPQCSAVTRSPASPADGDADGVPDSVRFTLNACVVSYPAESDTLKGTIDILDPTTAADHAVERIFTSVTRVRVRSGKSSYETWNGTRMTTRDSSTLHHGETNFRTDYVFPDGGVASNVRTWTSTFTADAAGSIAADQPLPSGTWTFNGALSWTQGGTTYSVTVTTSSGLHYNASCTATPRFDAGTLTAVVTQSSQTSTVTVQFPACGQSSATKT